MKIESLIYENTSTDWKLEKIEFKNKLTLLVGASGVGKTRILKAILNLQNISQGTSINGLKWKVELSNVNGNNYIWCGEFENRGYEPPSVKVFEAIYSYDVEDKPNLINETLYLNGKKIIDRDINGIIFNDKKTVKLSQQESVLHLLKEEDGIKELHEELSKLIYDDNASDSLLNSRFLYLGYEGLSEHEHLELSEIRNSNITVSEKLLLTHKHQKPVFDEIRNLFIDIFPYVENVAIRPIEISSKKFNNFFDNKFCIFFKEKNVNLWLDAAKISSGMYRTLMHLAELYLCADGSVILIDEFENSLGINCIEEISSSIIESERDIQFIITSHHPYIINNINHANWKLVTRKGGIVNAKDVDALGIEKSNHEAFTLLMNQEAYAEGVEF